jgi:hypothetical protein
VHFFGYTGVNAIGITTLVNGPVILDLNGHTITGPGGNSGSGINVGSISGPEDNQSQGGNRPRSYSPLHSAPASDARIKPDFSGIFNIDANSVILYVSLLAAVDPEVRGNVVWRCAGTSSG